MSINRRRGYPGPLVPGLWFQVLSGEGDTSVLVLARVGEGNGEGKGYPCPGPGKGEREGGAPVRS